MSEVIKVCIRQPREHVAAAIAEILANKIPPFGHASQDVHFRIYVDYPINIENPYGDFCTLTITD